MHWTLWNQIEVLDPGTALNTENAPKLLQTHQTTPVLVSAVYNSCLFHWANCHQRVAGENARRPTQLPGAPSAFWPSAEAWRQQRLGLVPEGWGLSQNYAPIHVEAIWGSLTFAQETV